MNGFANAKIVWPMRGCKRGRGEIRTHGPLAWTTVFKTVALNRLATLPFVRINYHKSMENSSFFN